MTALETKADAEALINKEGIEYVSVRFTDLIGVQPVSYTHLDVYKRQVLVMDEPTFGQDFTTWTEMVKLIAGARDAGCSVIMVTHDEPLIETLGARRVLVSEGE